MVAGGFQAVPALRRKWGEVVVGQVLWHLLDGPQRNCGLSRSEESLVKAGQQLRIEGGKGADEAGDAQMCGGWRCALNEQGIATGLDGSPPWGPPTGSCSPRVLGTYTSKGRPKRAFRREHLLLGTPSFGHRALVVSWGCSQLELRSFSYLRSIVSQ